MRILVAATLHGATREIAENIATSIGSAPVDAGVWSEVDVRDAGLVRGVDGFDAVVLGSAVYMGHWLEPARTLAESFVDDLREVPVWHPALRRPVDRRRPEAAAEEQNWFRFERLREFRQKEANHVHG